MDTADAFLALSPEGFGSFITTSPPPPAFAAQDFAFAHVLETANTPSLSLAFPQASHEYPPLMSPELMQLFGASEIMPQTVTRPPQFLPSQDIPSVNTHAFSFPPELLANTAITPAMIPMIPQQTQIQPQMQLQMQMQQIQQVPVQSTVATSQVGVVPHLDIKAEPTDTPWLSYMHEVLSHPLPFQSSLASITSNACQMPANPQSVPFQVPIIKQELTSPQSSALQKLHQRLLQRLRKSQQDCPIQEEPEDALLGVIMEPAQLVISESSKKADSSFNKVLELFSFYFNTQKTASPLACTAALYLGQVGFELQKRYEAYSRYIKCGVLEEILISMTRASNLRKLGIKSYEEFLRAEVGELRRIKDPERYLNRRMQVFQSYEPEELEGVYLSFDALYLLAKKPPSFRKEWLEEGKVRIVHICEIHEAWRSSPLNKTKRARTPEVEESNDAGAQKAKVLKSEH